MNRALFENLERAIYQRSPTLAGRLKPGIDEQKIRQMLKKQGVGGNVRPVLELFSWKNGSRLDPTVKPEDAKFFPQSIYMFLDLETMLAHFQGVNRYAKSSSKPRSVSEQFFPLFWNGAENYLALDLSLEGSGAIAVIDPHFQHPVWQIYESFDELMGNAIEANWTNQRVQRVPSYLHYQISMVLLVVESNVRLRNPALAARLRKGLSEHEVRALLDKAGVAGDVEPIVSLFSWRNGTVLDNDHTLEELSLFPNSSYIFLDLKTMIDHYSKFETAYAFHPKGTQASNRFFPIFCDNTTSYLAVDLKPSNNYRVVVLDFDSEDLIETAYPSFEEFLNDVNRANVLRDQLTCFKTW